MPRGFGKPPRRDNRPSTAMAQAAELLDLGLVLHRQGRLAEAIVRYGQALDFQADYVEAHFALALALQARGEGEEAIHHFQRAIELRSYYTDAHFALGTALQEQQDFEGALGCYQRTLAIEPEYVKAHNNLGAVQRELGDLDGAIASYRRALALESGYVEAHNNLGVALRERGQLEEAALCFKRAFQLQPDFAEAYYNLGLLLHAQQKLAEAIAVYRTALIIKGDLVEARVNLAHALQGMGQGEAAIEEHRRAVELAPALAEAQCGLGNALRDAGRLAEAAECYAEALRLKPDYAEARHYLAAVGAAPTPATTDPEYVAALFDEYAERFDRHLTGELAYRAPELLVGAIQAVTPHSAGLLNVLDLGCGTGLCGPLLRPLAQRLVGMDLSAKMLSKAYARGVYDDLAVGEMTEWLGRHHDAFDLIVAADVFTYVGDLAAVFAAAALTLVPGGVLAFSVEAGEAGYTLLPNGRYAHALDYVQKQAAAAALVAVSAERAILRTERGRAVEGWIVVLRSLR
ncbi:tetratricopeptide repeat protein [Gloeobacter morelensis]|uniref:Tetratricopeptide repeat protein n=1 Tax=Gloeobacter morelensis MG652769 TaxID=2781736 RepID=A0ABY3PNM1_9CYAN|nr:tetratricopeptide repeat protein [Gloeobacter morelensis]UFP95002.1 tetratricopeptide repeat protein [Gloeobacter morelensis MG652769]